MGWGYGQLSNGKEVGYSVVAQCEHPGCEKEIDRGLAFVCGTMHGEDEYSCDGYFCEKHKRNFIHTDEGDEIRICDNCRDVLLGSGEWEMDEEEGMIVRIPAGGE